MIRNQVSVSESETRGQFGCLYICCCMRSCFNAFHRLGPSSASITVFLCFLGLAWGWWRTDFDFVGGELAAPTSTAERQAPTISNPSSQLSIAPLRRSGWATRGRRAPPPTAPPRPSPVAAAAGVR